MPRNGLFPAAVGPHVVSSATPQEVPATFAKALFQVAALHASSVHPYVSAPPNSPQKLARPGFGPAAEPPR